MITRLKLQTDSIYINLKSTNDKRRKKEKILHNIQNTQYSMGGKGKETIFIDSPKWNIVTTLISGISKSLSIVQSDEYHILQKRDYTNKNTIEISSNNSTFNKCIFVDYSPYVFQEIRSSFGISIGKYLQSIGISTFEDGFIKNLKLMLSEKSSGKSGSFFFYSSDGKYLIKTITK